MINIFEKPEERWVPMKGFVSVEALEELGFERIAGTETFSKYIQDCCTIRVTLEAPIGLGGDCFWKQVADCINREIEDRNDVIED